VTIINYGAPPTCAAFMKSAAFGRVILGPVGSGKTTACLMELFRRACEQAPAPDGLRYTRFAIVRQTLQALKATVLKDIMSWYREAADYRVSESTVYINIGDVRSEFILIPLENPEDQRRLLSMQLTGAWISEAVELQVDLISPLAGRLGRYPSGGKGSPTWFGWIADSNLCAENTPWHKYLTNPPADTQVFIQPGGLEPNAENLEWLTQTDETIKLRLDIPEEREQRRAQGRTYYERFVRSNSPDWCKIFVHAQWGDDPSGTAVFRESFKSSFHVVDELSPIPGYPLIVGQDFGRDPCSVICQMDHKGRLLVLEEVLAEDIGLELHIERSLRPALMHERYLGRPVVIVGDPAGKAKSTSYEETSFDLVKRMGFMAYPAPSNNIDRRLRSVEAFLLAQRDGGPAMLFDRDKCPQLVRAMSGGYRYAKTRAGNRKPNPDKNDYSHIADALQYAALAAHGGMVGMIAGRLTRRVRQERTRVSAAAWT
jgi:hypothetical protein